MKYDTQNTLDNQGIKYFPGSSILAFRGNATPSKCPALFLSCLATSVPTGACHSNLKPVLTKATPSNFGPFRYSFGKMNVCCPVCMTRQQSTAECQIEFPSVETKEGILLQTTCTQAFMKCRFANLY